MTSARPSLTFLESERWETKFQSHELFPNFECCFLKTTYSDFVPITWLLHAPWKHFWSQNFATCSMFITPQTHAVILIFCFVTLRTLSIFHGSFTYYPTLETFCCCQQHTSFLISSISGQRTAASNEYLDMFSLLQIASSWIIWKCDRYLGWSCQA